MRERIVNIIKSLGITQKQFAEQIGITGGGLTDYIKGRSKDLSGSTIANIAIKYNVNPTWLLTGEGEMFLPSTPLGDREPTSLEQGEEPKPPETKKRSQNGNHLSALEGGVKEYPDIDDSDQIARTAWYRALPDESQYVINALDELRDHDALIALKRIALSAVAKERAEKEAKLKSDELNEAMKKLLDDFMDEHEKDLRKKGEAG